MTRSPRCALARPAARLRPRGRRWRTRHFRAAADAMRECDPKAMKPARMMGATYAAILARLERSGWSTLTNA